MATDKTQGKSTDTKAVPESSAEASSPAKAAAAEPVEAEVLGTSFSTANVFRELARLALLTYPLDPAGAATAAVADAWWRRAELRPRISELEAEISRLRAEIDQRERAIITEKASAKRQQEQIAQIEADRKALNEKQRLAHLISRVGEAAGKKLLESEAFRDEFTRDEPRPAYVVSIDIRRSTELMLKARRPRLFAEFITTLAKELREIIMRNYGVFDKFTGDGILAFFPEFFSGSDAGYYALKSALESHAAFTAIYKEHRRCFSSVLRSAGLGIGIDFGDVDVVQIGGDVTVVGTPVVYACRMSGGPAGDTLVNEPAYERLFAEYSAYCDFDETDLEIKHEGAAVAHRARLNGKSFQAEPPSWAAATA